jgi:hypothetical protein
MTELKKSSLIKKKMLPLFYLRISWNTIIFFTFKDDEKKCFLVKKVSVLKTNFQTVATLLYLLCDEKSLGTYFHNSQF